MYAFMCVRLVKLQDGVLDGVCTFVGGRVGL